MSVTEIPQLQTEWARINRLAVWVASWLAGQTSTDDATAAWFELYSDTPREALPDALRAIRTASEHFVFHSAGEPAVQIVLAGPGEPPRLPHSEAARQMVADAGAGLIVATGLAEDHLLLVPGACSVSSSLPTQRLSGPLAVSPFLSAGEADLALADATRTAARLIDSSGIRPAAVPDIRLRVGRLTDAFDVAGFPPGTDPRALKLCARADHVAAIIEATREQNNGAAWDPQLLPLLTAIRQARIASVERAARELYQLP